MGNFPAQVRISKSTSDFMLSLGVKSLVHEELVPHNTKY